MIVLSLDEYGRFERNSSYHNKMFIGGVLFDDKGHKDETDLERKRIKSYFIQVCSGASSNGVECKYPRDLHFSSIENKNREHMVGKVIEKTLVEFLQKGTYCGKKLFDIEGNVIPKRKGEYYVYTLYKSQEGKRELTKSHGGIFSDDDTSANLYFHMVDDTLSRLVFNNPVVEKETEYGIYAATRVSQSYEKDTKKSNEFNEKGYNHSGKKSDNKTYFYITNQDVYRTVIEKDIVSDKGNLTDIKFLRTESIDYSCDDKEQEFLYMADTVCSYLSSSVMNDEISVDMGLNKIVKKAETLIGENRALIFSYDYVDVFYQNAWEAYERNDYYNAFSNVYEGQLLSGIIADYYRKKWFPMILNAIKANLKSNAFSEAILKLSNSIMSNKLKLEKEIFIYNALEECAEGDKKIWNTPEGSSILYKLYDSGVALYCHMGMAEKAFEKYDKCKEYALKTTTEEHLRTLNRIVNCSIDSFDISQALQLAQANVVYQGMLSQFKTAMAEARIKQENVHQYDENIFKLGESKALSQLAQVYAFLREERAENTFCDAMLGMQRPSADYYITESYLLHYFIDNGMKEKYMEFSADYFGGKRDLSEQLSYVIDEGKLEDPKINLSYGLYLYVRAAYTFFQDEITDELWKKLNSIEWELQTNKQSTNMNHPWELIYKYLYLLAKRHNREVAMEVTFKLMRKAVKGKGDLLCAIEKYAEVEIAKEAGNKEEIKKALNRLTKFLTGKWSVFNTESFLSADDDKKLEYLAKKFTYMYR